MVAQFKGYFSTNNNNTKLMLQNYLIIFFGVEKSFIKFYRKNSVNKRGRKFNFKAKTIVGELFKE